MLRFIVDKNTYDFPRDKSKPVFEQVEDIVNQLREKFPEKINIYKSQISSDCWHLLGEFLNINEISNITGYTYHNIRNRIKTVKCYDRLPAKHVAGQQPLVAYEDFVKYKFKQNFVEKEDRRKRYKLLLEGKDQVIQKFYNDQLSLGQIAKALGVSRNTLVAYIDKKMPELKKSIISDRKSSA